MPYFLLLPLFLLGLVVQSVLLVASALLPSLAALRPYVWRILVWSSAGFVVANVLLTIVCVIPFAFADELGLTDANPVHKVIGLLAGLGLLVGPFVASAGGFGLGVWIAIRGAKRARARPAVT